MLYINTRSFIVIARLAAVAVGLAIPAASVEAQSGSWIVSAKNPVLGMYRAPLALEDRAPGIWNDPSVLDEDDGYSMWASFGRSSDGVAIYKLRSRDGETWEVVNRGLPVLERGAATDFDSLGVETPEVVKVGGVYHMYYSAFRYGQLPLITIGHATSEDGIAWTKLGELTSLTAMVGQQAGNRWGWLGRGEPSVVHHQGRFHLYFTDVRCRVENCSGSPAAVRGISLATSVDGHEFTQQGATPVLQQTASYPAADGWEGYSTPDVVMQDGVFELFCDVFRKVGTESIQTTLTHFRSADGVAFQEYDKTAMTAGAELWAGMSVRSPAVVVSADGVWRMWYAGDNYDPIRKQAKSGAVNAGIGIATQTAP